MLSHVTADVRDLARSTAFHDAVSAPPGSARRWEGAGNGVPESVGRAPPGPHGLTFFVQRPFGRYAMGAGNGRVTAVLAPLRDAARRARAAGLAAGGPDEGTPGEGPRHGRGRHGVNLHDLESDAPRVARRGQVAGA